MPSVSRFPYGTGKGVGKFNKIAKELRFYFAYSIPEYDRIHETSSDANAWMIENF